MLFCWDTNLAASLVGAVLAGFARYDSSPQGTVWCKHTVVAGLIDPWPGYQSGKSGE